jgi:hypothetical protein
MNLKMKLTSSILAFCMVLSLLIVGVFSTSTASVSMSGSLTFTASNIYAKVEGSVSGTKTTHSLTTLNYSASSEPTTAQLNTWKPTLDFNDSGTNIVLTIKITNNASDRPLYVNISDTVTTSVSNLGKSLSDESATIAAGGSKTFTITFSITDKNASLSNATYGYEIELNNNNVSTNGYTATFVFDLNQNWNYPLFDYVTIEIDGEEMNIPNNMNGSNKEQIVKTSVKVVTISALYINEENTGIYNLAVSNGNSYTLGGQNVMDMFSPETVTFTLTEDTTFTFTY